MPSSSGIEPPDSDVPAPRGTIFTFISCASAMIALHLRYRLRQRDDQRQRAIHGEGVAVIGAARDLVGDHALRGKNCPQPRQNLVAAREDFRLGRGH